MLAFIPNTIWFQHLYNLNKNKKKQTEDATSKYSQLFQWPVLDLVINA